MKIDIIGVQAFVAIADHGGFQKAADVLNITQTAITQRLRHLEDFLGVTLIERTTRSVGLTTIGEDFLPRARRLLQELSAALTEIRETGKAQRGDVSVACVPTAGIQYLPAIIQEYSARYPENRIKILDHSSFGVAQAVLRREAEFGINVATASHPELVSTPLVEDQFVLICRDDHPVARAASLTWAQLEGHALIFAGQVNGNRPLRDSLLGGTADIGPMPVALQAHYEVQRSSTAVGLVAAGIAAAVVPKLAMQSGAYPRLRVIPLLDPVISRTLALVVRKGARLSPAAQVLHDLILARSLEGERSQKGVTSSNGARKKARVKRASKA
ncbi:transcriptional regulator, LysR family [Noviherbaspirillum humi]|uniref:Transcriptional regulator, LysR family n=1 Tax=Noviherbaspirillum humi TaxID=1688639 RepID=A0A239L2U8_9BURK|nr:LysR family transcriptional regulator [Noviherbaspirillum humi]SNT24640.1 transcriptional regulator, LysR family [Noviherbaspirillum humi]